MDECCIFFAIEDDDVNKIEQIIADRHRVTKQVGVSACSMRGSCIYDPDNRVESRNKIYQIANELGKEKVKSHFG